MFRYAYVGIYMFMYIFFYIRDNRGDYSCFGVLIFKFLDGVGLKYCRGLIVGLNYFYDLNGRIKIRYVKFLIECLINRSY